MTDTPALIAQARAALDGVTPSEAPNRWYVAKRYSFIAHKDTWQVVWDVPNSTALDLVADTGGNVFSDERNARFIAAARELVPALATALEAAEARADAAEQDRNEADNALVDRYRDPQSGRFNFPTDVAAIVRRLDAAEAALAAEKARNARLTEADHRAAVLANELTKAANRLDWCAGLLATPMARENATVWAEEARAALTQKDRTDV